MCLKCHFSIGIKCFSLNDHRALAKNWMQAVSPLFKHIFYPLALIEKNSRKWTFSKIEYVLWQPPQPSYLHRENAQECYKKRKKQKCEKQEELELQKMKSCHPLSEMIVYNLPAAHRCKGVDYWLGAASKQNWNTYSVPSWDAEQVWAEASGIRAPILDKEAITQRTHGRHISTSTSAGSMRHFWSLPWQGTLEIWQFFREVTEGA